MRKRPNTTRSISKTTILRKSTALLASVAAIAAASIALATPASATCIDTEQGRNLSVRVLNVSGSYWPDILQRSMNNWNNTGVTNLRASTFSANSYRPGEYDSSNPGFTATITNRDGTRYFDMYINARVIREFAPRSVNTDFGHWNRVISVHEWGHPLGLGDNPTNIPSGEYSIMQYPPLTYYFAGRFHDWGYYSLPTSYDAREVVRCNS